jgi:hypothetical protein
VDFSAYRRAFALLVRYPKVLLGPLVAGVLADLVLVSTPATYAGSFGETVASFAYRYVSLVIVAFGLAFALIVANQAWEGHDRSLSDYAYVFGNRILIIFFTAVGANFMVFVASQLGALFGPIAGLASAALSFAALFFLAYAYAGAAIRAIPAATAIEMSIESAWDNWRQTLPLAFVSLIILQFVPTLVEQLLEPLLIESGIFRSAAVPSLIIAIIVSVFNAYLALVIAKTYADLAIPHPRLQR